MDIFITDRQQVAETGSIAGKSVLFEMFQQGPIAAYVTWENQGVNPVSYKFQQLNGATWEDLDVEGTTLNGIMPASGSNSKRSAIVTSAYAKIRLLGSASGGSVLSFTVTRKADRADGGPLPILSF